MRDFKFRAYASGIKQMLYFDNPILCFADLSEGQQFGVLFKAMDTKMCLSGYGDLMQYTGLKDKNGREIYEGDIVRGIMPQYVKDCLGVVEYHGMAFGYWGKGADGTEWMDTITSKSLEKTKQEEGIEVIGNIYENPELMAGDK